MSCSCQRASTNGIQVVLPHAVQPDESCIFCAYKHVSTAYALLASMGLHSISRQRIIGELELARRHTQLEYKTEHGLILNVLLKTLFREPMTVALEKALDTIHTAVDIELKEAKTTNVTASNVLRLPNTVSPFMGELHFSAAWELAQECGYAKHNRSMIVGDLVLAQQNWTGWTTQLDIPLRDIRHAIQRSEEGSLKMQWSETALLCDQLISNSLTELASYSKELSLWSVKL